MLLLIGLLFVALRLNSGVSTSQPSETGSKESEYATHTLQNTLLCGFISSKWNGGSLNELHVVLKESLN